MKKKIFISIFEMLDIGGVATSLHNFINELSTDYDIDLCVLTNVIAPKYTFPDNVRILHFPKRFEYIYGDKSRMTGSFLQKNMKYFMRTFRKFYGYEKTLSLVMKSVKFSSKYDIAIAFWNDSYDKNGVMQWGGDYYNVIHNVEANYKIAWIHNDADQMGFTNEICKTIFHDFDAFVNVSKEGKDKVDSIIPEYKYKSHIVYNCYNINDILQKAGHESPYPDDGKLHFVNVCRINERQKKLSRILEVCKRLKNEGFNNFDWTIVGEGSDMDEYLRIVLNDNIGDFVKFVGLQSNPYPYMKFADAFIMSSLFEGLPMTIKEAQILGTPTFSTKFGSAEEAILSGKQGEICENSTEGLYHMVKELISNSDKLKIYKNYLLDKPISNKKALEQFNKIFTK